MDNREFDRILTNRITAIKQVLASKGKEYGRMDRLHNFKRAAAFMRTSPEVACFSFSMKHFTSIADIVDDTNAGYVPTKAMVNEKIGDAINYLILLEALLDERITAAALKTK